MSYRNDDETGHTMRNITYTRKDGTTWEQVTKTTARKAYAAGATVGVAGSNANPSSPWGTVAYVDYTPGCGVRLSDGPAACFEQMENSAMYYLDPEMGRYLVYYVERAN